MMAVNAAITLARPLLIKGEPGTGKTLLAQEIARSLDSVRCSSGTSSPPPRRSRACTSTTRCRACATRSSARQRVHDIAQLHRQGTAVGGVRVRGAAGAADRRDRQGRHRVPERPAARARSHGVLRLRDARAGAGAAPARSSSSPATTRRSCRTPSCAAASSTTSASRTRRRCARSSTCTIPDLKKELLGEALDAFFEVRATPGAEEEALDLRAARLDQAADGRGHPARGAALAATTKKIIPPLHGALLKNEQDVHLFERLVFMHRRAR